MPAEAPVKKLFKFVSGVLYTLVALTVTLFSGCAYITPTLVPPLSREIGYEIPSWGDWTTTGLNESVYRIEVEKLKILRVMVDVVNIPALEAREGAINWLNVGLSAGMFGGIPLAGALIPRRKEKDLVKEALMKPSPKES